ncbi:MAG: HEAT repeat domain-containing protein [Trebonia sp.]
MSFDEVSAGLDAVSWGDLRHNYGAAGDVPGLLRECANAVPDQAASAVGNLDNLLFHQGGWVCPAAAAALPFLAALASDPGLTVRVDVVEMIGALAHEATRVKQRYVDPGWSPALRAVTPALLGLLGDGDPAVRRAAVYVAGAGGIGTDLALASLRARLDEEPAATVRWDIVTAMGEAAAGSGRAEDIGRELAAVADGTADVQVRLAAVHGLAALGEPVSRHAGLMADAVTRADAGGWQESTWLGGNQGTLVTATGALLLGDRAAAVEYAVNVSTRGGALQRAAALGHAGALMQEWRAVPGTLLPFIGGKLGEAEAEVRYRAAYLLACAGRDAAPYADQVAALVGDGSPAGFRGEHVVGDAAVWALARAGDPRAVPELERRLAGGRLGFRTVSMHYGRQGLPFTVNLPSIGAVLTRADAGGELTGPAAALLRTAHAVGNASLAAMLCESIGERADAMLAVPALLEVLRESPADRFPGPAAAFALGRIGAAAHGAAAELRRLAREGSGPAAWALWRVTGDPAEALPVLAAGLARAPRGHALARHLADLGPLAAGTEGQLRTMLGEADHWARAEAAHALWRITGDRETAVSTLAAVVAPLANGEFLPARLAAMRYLAAIPDPGNGAAAEVTVVAQSVLDNPRRLASSGGWRLFDEDDQIRISSGNYLDTRQ